MNDNEIDPVFSEKEYNTKIVLNRISLEITAPNDSQSGTHGGSKGSKSAFVFSVKDS